MLAVQGSHAGAAAALTEARAPLIADTASGDSTLAAVLMRAVRARSPRCLAALLKAAAGTSAAGRGPADVADGDGRTPLHVAVLLSDYDVRPPLLCASVSMRLCYDPHMSHVCECVHV